MPSAADRRLFWAAAAAVVGLDFATKLVAEARLLRTAGLEVMGNWIQLRLVYNPGAAFGLHVGPYSRWVFFAIAIVAVAVLVRMSRTSPAGDRFRQLALGLITGGAAGNLIDRIRWEKGVVDFIDVGFRDMRWPTFNVADMAVSTGAFLLAWVLWGDDRAEQRARAAEATSVAAAGSRDAP